MFIVIEPVMTIVMRAGKKEVIMILFLHIDQAIAADQIELFAIVYSGLPAACQFVDLLRLQTSIGSQRGNNLFDALGSECPSATGAAHFIETFMELRFTVNKHRHSLP